MGNEGGRERERETDPLDEVGVFDEADGAPERVVDGSAVSLQLGSEPSVHHSTTSCFLYHFLQQRRRFLQSHLSRYYFRDSRDSSNGEEKEDKYINAVGGCWIGLLVVGKE